ncbi:branched-chain amino acid ABC transporter permease [Caballeronia sp. ATUFL_M1_KS5A]|uniref:branched-chain amino acid ABC transporter permease n=1 Tax=Caballeronia sp. ATUFL_M1_KS5A TaxID=2921778 RepID=UPI002028D8FB|nr:branched-chain amino acid ABC transporter permease [Caballeronia sp. ATUFL_M1_KS5A]
MTALGRVFSGDRPRSHALTLLLATIAILLVAAPFVIPGAKTLSIAVRILVFIVLVGSFDLMLGYTGIVSFAHTMFFGIGAYGVAIASSTLGPQWHAILLGLAVATVASILLSLAIAAFSLRVKAIFFAMITLCVASAFQTLASQLSALTGGEDGLTFEIPVLLKTSTVFVASSVNGVEVNGQTLLYYVLLCVSMLSFLVLLRIVNSPFGRALQAIRENEFRASAIGFRVTFYRSAASVISAVFACLAGGMMALWLRYNGPDTTLSMEIMVDVLLVTVIGGMGTMYGSVIGTTVFMIAQGYLQDLLRVVHRELSSFGLLADFFSPDRWLVWLGILFVLSVYFFPDGIVGRLRSGSPKRSNAQ